MKPSEMYAHQQQAQQLRALERAAAVASGTPLRPLTWTEREVLGVKDPKDPADLAERRKRLAVLKVERREQNEARKAERGEQRAARKSRRAEKRAAKSPPPAPWGPGDQV